MVSLEDWIGLTSTYLITKSRGRKMKERTWKRKPVDGDKILGIGLTVGLTPKQFFQYQLLYGLSTDSILDYYPYMHAANISLDTYGLSRTNSRGAELHRTRHSP